jgi:hypothetical protein
MKKLLILFSAIALLSCEKEEQKNTYDCDCMYINDKYEIVTYKKTFVLSEEEYQQMITDTTGLPKDRINYSCSKVN